MTCTTPSRRYQAEIEVELDEKIYYVWGDFYDGYLEDWDVSGLPKDRKLTDDEADYIIQRLYDAQNDL